MSYFIYADFYICVGTPVYKYFNLTPKIQLLGTIATNKSRLVTERLRYSEAVQ